jgi:hypothetical protein
MSRSQVYKDLFAMLSDMTVANGYSRDYNPVKSVDNSSAGIKQTPFISLHFGYEEPVTEGVGMMEFRSLVPVIITARVKVLQQTRGDIEYDEDVERSLVVEDIKKRFAYSYKEMTTSCVQVPDDSWTEEEPREDSNKHDMYVKYGFGIIYKQPK